MMIIYPLGELPNYDHYCDITVLWLSSMFLMGDKGVMNISPLIE